MNSSTVSSLRIYPIKSTKGIWLQESQVVPRGLQYDRQWALCKDQKTIITGRNYPQLLDISAQITEDILEIKCKEELALSIPIPSLNLEEVAVELFRNPVSGMTGNKEVNQWFSEFLGISTQLIFMPKNLHRPIFARHGGLPGDEVAYPDAAPILLLSEASLADLNSRLESPVDMDRFRPNIVVKGVEAYAEDQWKSIRIGDCELEVVCACKRCIFTTIDPETKAKHPNKEPLRTLSTYRKQEKGGIAFGRYVIPRKGGTIRLGDEIIPTT